MPELTHRLFGWRQPPDEGGGQQPGGGGAPLLGMRRATPGFLPQFGWSLSRAVLKRLREPLSVFTDFSIFALTGG